MALWSVGYLIMDCFMSLSPSSCSSDVSSATAALAAAEDAEEAKLRRGDSGPFGIVLTLDAHGLIKWEEALRLSRLRGMATDEVEGLASQLGPADDAEEPAVEDLA